MSNSKTIDGVSRDSVLQLIEFLTDAKAYHKVVIGRCEDCIRSGESSEREEYGRISFRTKKIEQVERLAEELRALLDATEKSAGSLISVKPDVLRALFAPNANAVQLRDAKDAARKAYEDWSIAGQNPAAQPQGEPVAYLDLEKIQPAGMAYATKMRVNHRQAALYAEQPAPVSAEPGEPYAYEYEFATVLYSTGPGKFKKVIETEAPDQHEIDAGCIINVKPLYSSEPRKYDDTLLPFLALMRKELHANSHKGDREGWLGMSAESALCEVEHHSAKLKHAVHSANAELIKEHAADVANCAMMLADVCGLLTNNQE